jgi:hypothetical protein
MEFRRIELSSAADQQAVTSHFWQLSLQITPT